MSGRAAALLCAALVGCAEDVNLSPPLDGGLPGLVSLAITPAASDLTIQDPAPRSVTLTASGRFIDGSERDVTGDVIWSVDDPVLGAFSLPGLFTTSNAAGGRLTVTARSGAFTAQAAVTIVVYRTIVDPDFPPPPGAGALFAPEVPVLAGDLGAPLVLYPNHQTLFPLDVGRVLFQYDQGMGNDAWLIRFDSDTLHLAVLTGGDRWRPEPEIWTLITRSNKGATTSMQIFAGATGDPSTIHASPAIDLSFSPRGVGGLVSYRSATSGGLLAARLADAAAVPLFPEPPDVTCAGCHAVSRDGSLLAAGYGGEVLQVVALPDGNELFGGRDMGWAAFSPAGDRLLLSDRGQLRLLELPTGDPALPMDGRVPLSGGAQATHPDWSPDGRHVAVALGTAVNNRDLRGGGIARLPYGGAFGEPDVLVPSTSDADNNFFPRHAPRGDYLIYVHADSTAAQNAPTAELRLIPVAGGEPIPLRLASHRVGVADDVPDLGSTMPAWAPVADGALAWVVFTSTRPYGHLLPTGGEDRIWIAAVELDRAAVGLDPSRPAFWLPAQEVTSMNYAPCWGVEPGPSE